MFLNARAHYIDAAATAHNLAMLTNLFDGRTDFHDRNATLLGLLVAVRNTATAQVIRGQFHGDLVAGQNFNKMHTHLARDVTEDFVTVFEHYAKGSVRKALLNHTVNLNGLFFGNTKPLY